MYMHRRRTRYLEHAKCGFMVDIQSMVAIAAGVDLVLAVATFRLRTQTERGLRTEPGRRYRDGEIPTLMRGA